MSPLAVLGSDMQFARGVKVALPGPTREVIQAISKVNLLKGRVEMLCCALVMVQLGSQDRESHAEEISRLELSEPSASLKQSLAVNSEYVEKLARDVAEKEKVQQEAVEAEHQRRKWRLRWLG